MNFFKGRSKNGMELEILVQIAHGSAARVRLIIIVMVTASILALGSLWNSLPFSWKTKRYERSTYLIENIQRLENEYIDFLVKQFPHVEKDALLNSRYDQVPAKKLCDLEVADFKQIEDPEKTPIIARKELWPQNIKKLKPNDFEKIILRYFPVDRLKNFNNTKLEKDSVVQKMSDHDLVFAAYMGRKILAFYIAKVSNADKLLYDHFRYDKFNKKNLEKLFLLKSTEQRDFLDFKIPFFEIKLDINDLGMFGGFSFTIILLLLYMSLVRESENIKFAFKVSKEVFDDDSQSRECFYNFLAMNQLYSLTELCGYKKITAFSRWIFLRAPLLFSFSILINDILTFNQGKAMSPDNWFINSSIIISGLWLGLIFLLTMKCQRTIKQIDAIWKEESDNIKKHNKSLNPPGGNGKIKNISHTLRDIFSFRLNN